MKKASSSLTIQQDEAIEIPQGEPGYYLLISDEDCEGLRVGRVTLSLRRRAADMLSWKLDQELLDIEAADRANTNAT